MNVQERLLGATEELRSLTINEQFQAKRLILAGVEIPTLALALTVANGRCALSGYATQERMHPVQSIRFPEPPCLVRHFFDHYSGLGELTREQAMWLLPLRIELGEPGKLLAAERAFLQKLGPLTHVVQEDAMGRRPYAVWRRKLEILLVPFRYSGEGPEGMRWFEVRDVQPKSGGEYT